MRRLSFETFLGRVEESRIFWLRCSVSKLSERGDEPVSKLGNGKIGFYLKKSTNL